MSFLAGLIVVFNQGQYVAVSLVSLAVFGIGVAVGQLVIAFVGKGGLSAIESVPTSVIALAIGSIAALAQSQTAAQDPQLVVQEFSWLVMGWALTSGAFDLYLGRRAGFKSTLGRDFGIQAGLSLALGFIFLAAPMDRTTTVGIFVTYLMFSAVHLGLAASSPKTKSAK